MTLLVFVLRLILGGTFLISALPKLRNPKGFTLTVLEYRILPPYLSKLYGMFLPALEFTLALWTITGIMLRFATIIMSFLLFSFIVAISINIKSGRDLACNCFGRFKKRQIGKTLLIQDGMLLGGAIFISVTHTWTQVEVWSIFQFVRITNDEFELIFTLCIEMMISIILFWRHFLLQKDILVKKKQSLVLNLDLLKI